MYGQTIRGLRKEKNMTLKELEKELKIPFTTLGNYEREERHPDFDTLVEIANFFDVTIDYIVGRTEKRTHDEYVFSKDFKDLQDLLKNTEPNTRGKIVNAFDQLYLIVRGDMQDGSSSPEEIESIFEILNFIFRMKNNFNWTKREEASEFANIESTGGFIAEYLREKPNLDLQFNRLVEIYSERNFRNKE